jgi:hypothetical protein
MLITNRKTWSDSTGNSRRIYTDMTLTMIGEPGMTFTSCPSKGRFMRNIALTTNRGLSKDDFLLAVELVWPHHNLSERTRFMSAFYVSKYRHTIVALRLSYLSSTDCGRLRNQGVNLSAAMLYFKLLSSNVTSPGFTAVATAATAATATTAAPWPPATSTGSFHFEYETETCV